MASFKLYYFNGRGRAELIRWLFAEADQAYEDVRIEYAQWPALKPTAPFGSLPFVEITKNNETKKAGQSMTIARALARKFELDGKDPEEKILVDMYAELLTDLFNERVKAMFEKDESRKAQLLEVIAKETTPAVFARVETHLAKSTSGFFVNSGLTYTDLYLSSMLDALGDKKNEVLANFPHIKALDSNVRARPKIAAWIAKRPETPF